MNNLINLEIEQYVLSALMLEKEAISVVEGIIQRDSFTDPRNVAIFDAISSLHKNSKPIDIATIVSELTKMDKLQEAGGFAYPANVSALANSTSHLEYHARLLRDLQLKRDTIELGRKLMANAADPKIEITDTITKAEDAIIKLTSGGISDGTRHVGELMPTVINLISEASEKGGNITGIPTGLQEIDDITSGFQTSDLFVIAGRPGMGKTAIALTFVRALSVDFGIPTLIFSLEMGEVQLANRLLVLQSQVPNEKIKHGNLTSVEFERVMTATGQLEKAPIYIEDNANLSLYELRAKARKMVKDKGVKLIIIDYLQLMSLPDRQKGRSREQEVAAISRSLKVLAKELEITIVALSQLNRSVETRSEKGKRPQLSDLRESGAIEQDADIVAFTHRPEYYGILEDSDHADLRGKAEFIVAKQRNGRTGSVWLRFDAPTMRFYPDSSAYSQFEENRDEPLPF